VRAAGALPLGRTARMLRLGVGGADSLFRAGGERERMQPLDLGGETPRTLRLSCAGQNWRGVTNASFGR
jgi:hypothetical protein